MEKLLQDRARENRISHAMLEQEFPETYRDLLDQYNLAQAYPGESAYHIDLSLKNVALYLADTLNSKRMYTLCYLTSTQKK